MLQSAQARKQRKLLYEAPLHLRQKLVSANLSQKLREEFGRRSLPVRTGDKVKITRGEYAGLMGAVKEVDLRALKVTIEKITRKKVDGTEVAVRLHPSNLQIIEAIMEDKERQAIVKRSGGKITVGAVETKTEGKAETATEEVRKEEKTEVKKAEKKAAKKETGEKKEKTFKCPVCKSPFKTKSEQQQHIQKEHKEYR